MVYGRSITFPCHVMGMFFVSFACPCPSNRCAAGCSPGRFGFNWFLTGVTSFGPSTCGTKQAVYTRVHEYVDWIRNNIN